jgi:hypothetical protein
MLKPRDVLVATFARIKLAVVARKSKCIGRLALDRTPGLVRREDGGSIPRRSATTTQEAL